MGEVYVWSEMDAGNWEAPRGKGKFDIETGWAQIVVERYAPTYLSSPLSSFMGCHGFKTIGFCKKQWDIGLKPWLWSVGCFFEPSWVEKRIPPSKWSSLSPSKQRLKNLKHRTWCLNGRKHGVWTLNMSWNIWPLKICNWTIEHSHDMSSSHYLIFCQST